MRIVKVIWMSWALGGALLAQQMTAIPPPAQTEPARQQKVFELKYADADHLASVLSIFGYGIKSDRNLHVVAVSAPAEAMTAIEDAIKRLDVPTAAPKDIDLVVYMIVASEQAAAADTLPNELQPVASELKRVFPYKSFRLLDSIVLRTQPANRAQANGLVVLPNSGGGERQYEFSVYPNSVTEDPSGHLIRLDQLQLRLHMPGDHVASIQTEITVREGQRVVVGKSNMGADQALVMVLTAKVTQ